MDRVKACLDKQWWCDGLMQALPSPIDLMFYLGNRSGLRTGEAAGLGHLCRMGIIKLDVVKGLLLRLQQEPESEQELRALLREEVDRVKAFLDKQ